MFWKVLPTLSSKVPCRISTYRISPLTQMLTRNYSARRALLYVPGHDTKKLHKAMTLDVDCIVMDCEDGVATNRKDAARSAIQDILNSDVVTSKRHEWCVRINSVDSGLCEQDLNSLLTSIHMPETILLPKVESGEQLCWFADVMKSCLKEKKCNTKINLVMFIESARSVMDLPDICKKAEELSAAAPFLPVALVFGSDDLCASLGVTRSDDAMEMLYARQKLVVIARAFNLQAIDMVHIQFKDLEGLKKQCELGARMGYTGKQVIHPLQVPVVQEAFFPSPQKIKWAQDIVKAFGEHQQLGKGAFVYKGRMIDKPLLRQAKNILQLADFVSRGHSDKI